MKAWAAVLILSALVGLSVVLVSAVSFARSSRYRPAEVSLLAFSFQVSVGVGMVACGGGNANGGAAARRRPVATPLTLTDTSSSNSGAIKHNTSVMLVVK